jgi:hypothetical protein
MHLMIWSDYGTQKFSGKMDLGLAVVNGFLVNSPLILASFTPLFFFRLFDLFYQVTFSVTVQLGLIFVFAKIYYYVSLVKIVACIDKNL